MAKKKDPAAVSLGRRGGKKGGKARARNLSKERLSEIGREGAEARWAKYREEAKKATEEKARKATAKKKTTKPAAKKKAVKKPTKKAD